MNKVRGKGFPFELTAKIVRQITENFEVYFSSAKNRKEFYQFQLKAAKEPDRLLTSNHISWEDWTRPTTI